VGRRRGRSRATSSLATRMKRSSSLPERSLPWSLLPHPPRPAPLPSPTPELLLQLSLFSRPTPHSGGWLSLPLVVAAFTLHPRNGIQSRSPPLRLLPLNNFLVLDQSSQWGNLSLYPPPLLQHLPSRPLLPLPPPDPLASRTATLAHHQGPPHPNTPTSKFSLMMTTSLPSHLELSRQTPLTGSIYQGAGSRGTGGWLQARTALTGKDFRC
jgi:hypothetical protein